MSQQNQNYFTTTNLPDTQNIPSQPNCPGSSMRLLQQFKNDTNVSSPSSCASKCTNFVDNLKFTGCDSNNNNSSPLGCQMFSYDKDITYDYDGRITNETNTCSLFQTMGDTDWKSYPYNNGIYGNPIQGQIPYDSGILNLCKSYKGSSDSTQTSSDDCKNYCKQTGCGSRDLNVVQYNQNTKQCLCASWGVQSDNTDTVTGFVQNT